MPLGDFGEINTTTVYPSGRVSERVPFGTGRALTEWMSGKNQFMTYNFRTFQDLKYFTEQIPELYKKNSNEVSELLRMLPDSISGYLKTTDFIDRLKEIKKNVSTQKNFNIRFMRWLNGINVLKFVHYARDNFYPNVPLENAAIRLLNKIRKTDVLEKKILLSAYRIVDKLGT